MGLFERGAVLAAAGAAFAILMSAPATAEPGPPAPPGPPPPGVEAQAVAA
ncbi:thioredoxin, partial [Mycobacterium manitobense]|nr:thioredoxin [[Mycobacterium] manitobense]